MKMVNESCGPLVSIVTPVYNGSKYIEELITSVLEQDYPRIEHMVIDDGSDDDGATVGILRRYPHLRWWSTKNKGQYATLNEGMMAARGELVTVISADDKYAARVAVSSAVSALASAAEHDAVYGDTVRVDEDGHVVDNEPPRSVPIWLFRYYPGVSHCSLLVRRRFLIERGILFDESCTYFGDYDWIIRLIRSGCRFKRLRKPIAMYRQHALQRSLDVNPARTAELRRLSELHGKLNPIGVFIVNRWWRLTKLKNLFFHRGLVACVEAIYASCRPNTAQRGAEQLKD
jgi:glycosyltransferase involved in cell wall biosynthesis